MKKNHSYFSRPQKRPALKWLSCLLLTLGVSAPANAYERIVSTTGNASAVIAQLGLSDKLVAVDTTSTTPAEIMDVLPKIGYRRALSAEGILSMNPDLLILAPDAGPPNVIEQLNASNLNTITIADEKSLDGVIKDIELVAKTLKAEKAAQPMIDKIRADEQTIKKIQQSYARKPKVAFFMDGGIGRFMGLGEGTAGDGMIAIVGGENIFAKAFKSVKPVSLESLASEDVDVIIIAAHRGDAENKAMTKALDKYPKLAVTQAGKKDCVFTIGIVEALGFGPDVTDAAKSISENIIPCLKEE